MLNLIMIHTHDTGRYLQPYGQGNFTPNLQEFAEEATLFRNHYTCGPTCSPSRSSMLTGMYPHSCGMMGLAHRGFSIDYTKHLAQYLGRNGYETILCGMQHEADDPAKIGYDRVCIAAKTNRPEFITDWDRENSEYAIEFLRENHTKPFFLSYGLEHTHRPFNEQDEDIDPDYLGVPAPLPDNEIVRKDMAAFHTSARRADECIGKVLQEIYSLGLDKNTVIIYTTDHGIAFPLMKCNLYDSGTGVALLVRYPGNPTAGQAVQGITSHVDMFPTICDLLHLEKPEWLQGTSLLPLLENTKEQVNDCVYSEVTYHASYEPQRAVRTPRYKYIKRFNPQHTTPALSNMDNSITKEYMLEQGIAAIEIEQRQLFDLAFDPVERNNLAGNPAYAEIELELERQLERYMQDTKDPLLHGPVPLPKGAYVNRLSCENPDSPNKQDYEYA